jgi:hypothetical protein
MKLVIEGKTKRVFERPDGDLEFHFKDDATGYVDQSTGRPVFRWSGRSPGRGASPASSPATSSGS